VKKLDLSGRSGRESGEITRKTARGIRGNDTPFRKKDGGLGRKRYAIEAGSGGKGAHGSRASPYVNKPSEITLLLKRQVPGGQVPLKLGSSLLLRGFFRRGGKWHTTGKASFSLEPSSNWSPLDAGKTLRQRVNKLKRCRCQKKEMPYRCKEVRQGSRKKVSTRGGPSLHGKGFYP